MAAGGQQLGVGGLVQREGVAGVGPGQTRVPGAETDAELLGHQDQLAEATERRGAGAGHGGGAGP